MWLLTFISVLAAEEALWRRSDTWRSKWDAAATIGVALGGINVLLMEPEISTTISPWIHHATGMWNVEQLLAHLMHMGSLMCVLYMAVTRLKLSQQERRRMIQTLVELPCALFIGLGVANFLSGNPDRNVADLVLMDPNLMMSRYWLTLGCATLWLSGCSIWVFTIVARNPEARKTANIYIFACSVSIAVCVAGVKDLIDPGPNLMLWSVVRLELLAYSCAALYSWQHRTNMMLRQPQTFPDLEFPAPA